MGLEARVRRLAPQPLIAACTSAAAVILTARSWGNMGSDSLPGTLALTLLLFIALSLSYKFPVHIQQGTKLCMGTVPLYLLAALIPAPLSALVAGTGVLVGNWTVRAERALYLSDMLTDAACWSTLVVSGSFLGHAAWGPGVGPVYLATVGAALWSGEILSSPLLLYPVTRQRPHRIVALFLREGGITEASQYIVAFLGALVAIRYGWALLLLPVPLIPLYLAFKSSRETQESTRMVLESMADAVDLRDLYTGGHSRRVAAYAQQILQAMNIEGPEVDLILAAARVHDIGKIGIPDRVLLKDAKLTDEERILMEAHPENGARLLERYPDFSRGIEIVRHHHEQWDGGGYPGGLRGTEIPFGARVVAVADGFDAMTSDRPYRKGMPTEKALAILQSGRGRQWEGAIVDALVRSLTDAPQEEASPALQSGGARLASGAA